jgi:putative membrane protein
MRRFLVKVVINAVALWVTTLVLGEHFAVEPYAPGGTLETVITYLLVALVFGVVNGTLGNLIRIIAFPVYVLTLGLLALVVNALLLLLVAWLSSLAGFGLSISDFGWGVVAVIVLGLVSWVLGLILRPLTRERDR